MKEVGVVSFRDRVERYIKKSFSILLFLVFVFSLGSFLFERLWFPAHLLVHFQLQYWIVALACSLGLFLYKKYIYAISGAFYIVILYLIWIHGIIFYPVVPASSDVLFLNSQYDNKHIQSILDLVHRVRPISIALVESNPDLVQALAITEGDPLINHRFYASSCTLFSHNIPVQALTLGKNYLPICILKFKDFDLVTIHPHRPTDSTVLKENLKFYDEVQGLMQKYETSGRHFIIVGDFNSTRYSSYFRERFERYDQPILYTWMVRTPFSLPLDHVLTDMRVKVGRSEDVGSDHAALLINVFH